MLALMENMALKVEATLIVISVVMITIPVTWKGKGIFGGRMSHMRKANLGRHR